MLFAARFHTQLRDGEITCAFRRWKRPTVVAGGTLQSPGGLLGIDEVTAIDPHEITTTDAVAAGFPSVEAVLASLRPGEDRRLHRVRFHRISDDPRVELRDDADLAAADVEAITSQLLRWDRASTSGTWTRALLAEIAANPGQRSRDIAERLGVEQPKLKRRVRQLKGLGLTESLGTGYRLSPRGEAFSAAVTLPE